MIISVLTPTRYSYKYLSGSVEILLLRHNRGETAGKWGAFTALFKYHIVHLAGLGMDSIIRHPIGRPYPTRVRSPPNTTFRTFMHFPRCDFEQFRLIVLTRLRPASVTHDITVMTFQGISVIPEGSHEPDLGLTVRARFTLCVQHNHRTHHLLGASTRQQNKRPTPVNPQYKQYNRLYRQINWVRVFEYFVKHCRGFLNDVTFDDDAELEVSREACTG